MSKNDDLREALLKEDGGQAGARTDAGAGILARDERRVRRLKWVAGIAWGVFLLLLVVTTLIETGRRRPIAGVTTEMVSALLPEYAWFLQDTILLTEAMFMIAVLVTFYLHVRVRTLSMRQIRFHLAEIERQLRTIASKG